jgi:hypothetical protein
VCGPPCGPILITEYAGVGRRRFFSFEELKQCFSSIAIPLEADIKYVSSGIKIKSKHFQFSSPDFKERVELYR